MEIEIKKQKLKNILNKYKYFIYFNKLYIYIDNNFFLCSYENFLKFVTLGYNDFEIINFKTFKKIYNKIIEENENNILEEENFIKVKNGLVHSNTLELIKEVNSNRHYYLNYDNIEFEKKNSISIKKSLKVFKNITKMKDFLLELSAIYSSVNYKTIPFIIEEKNKESFNNLFSVISNKNFYFIEDIEEINNDLLYDKNIIRINYELLKNIKGKELFQRTLLDNENLYSNYNNFKGVIIIYIDKKDKLSAKFQKYFKNIYEYTGEDFKIEEFESELNEIFLLLLNNFYITKEIRNKHIINITNKVQKKITKKWIEVQLININKNRTEINIERILRKYQLFCNLSNMKPMVKSAFNFMLNNINTQINSQENNIIKNNKNIKS